MKWIDSFLDRITMYRLVLYYLIGLLAIAFGLSLVGILHYSAIDLAFSTLFLVAVCWISNKLFGYVFEAPTNVESPYITALILALIITPTHQSNGLVFLAAAGGLAIASKFILAINKRHIFNPAAIAVVLTSFGAGDSASWWIGTSVMVPYVLIGGYLMVRRIRRVSMVVWGVVGALASTAALAFLGHGNVVAALQKTVFDSALFFMAFVMLTEPLTSPTTKKHRTIYSLLVGALFPPQINLAGIYSTPELTLLLGNIYAFIVGPRTKVFMKLKQRIKLSRDSADFVFTPEKKFAFEPGQYMEFTLQHPKTDSRGARRYFTIASSPTEDDLHVGVKFYPGGSSYKKALLSMDNQTTVVAGQLGGDFTLPKNPQQKTVFIAGGIGITPFRSMIKYLIDTNQPRPITLLYAAKTPEDIVYRDVFDQAERTVGIKTYYAVSSTPTTPKPPVYLGRIDAAFITNTVPDYKDAIFYISGPHGMVVAVEEALLGLGVPRLQIKKDFFSGY